MVHLSFMALFIGHIKRLVIVFTPASPIDDILRPLNWLWSVAQLRVVHAVPWHWHYSILWPRASKCPRLIAWDPFLSTSRWSFHFLGHNVLLKIFLVSLGQYESCIWHLNLLLAGELTAHHKVFSDHVVVFFPAMWQVPRKVGVWLNFFFVYPLLFLLFEPRLRLAEWLWGRQCIHKLSLGDSGISVEIDSPNNCHQVKVVSDIPVLSKVILKICRVNIAIVPIVNALEGQNNIKLLVTIQFLFHLLKLPRKHNFLV